MSVHINAQKGEIAKVVLMPGDPLRAKHFAEKWLTNPVLVSSTRNVFYYTGTYKDVPVTIGASGMGCASIGIYSYELFNEYDVECIVRIGTAGSYYPEVKVYDLINVDHACSESTYAHFAFDMEGDSISHQGSAFDVIKETAQQMDLKLINGNIHSSDIFYRKKKGVPDVAVKHDCKAVEMEAFSLFANAKELGKQAATLLTVSDVIPTGEQISADAREKSLQPMIELALESAIRIHQSL
jgi:purine-nucleoside phosphorylase